jgi:protein SCO1/2
LRLPRTALRTIEGEAFSLADEGLGRVVLVVFGYTHCPDVCPVTLASIAAARTRVSGDVGSHPLVAFVGTDPDRDAPDVLGAFTRSIDPSIVGLFGSVADVDALLAELDQPPVVREAPGPDGSYGVVHIAATFAFTPDGLCHRRYPSGVRQAAWAADLEQLGRGRWT